MSAELGRILECNRCIDDCYDPFLQDCLEYISSNNFPKRISTIYSATQREEQKKKIKTNSRDMSVRICYFGTKHLYIENNKILMVKEAYDFVHQLHGEQHYNTEEMIQFIDSYPISKTHIFGFIKQFPSICPYCNRRQNQPKAQFSHNYWSILSDKFNISVKTMFVKENVEAILGKYDVQHCSGICLKDHYERDYEICIYILKNLRFPPLPKGEGSQLHRRRLKVKAKSLKIVTCNKGKQHLWTKDIPRRIPMVNQARYLASVLHGQAHRTRKLMVRLISEQDKIYPHAMVPYIKQYVNECMYCCARNPQPRRLQPMPKKFLPKAPPSTKPLTRQFTKISELSHIQKDTLRKKIEWGEDISSNPYKLSEWLNSVSIWDNILNIKQDIAKQFHISSLAAEMVIEDLHWSRADDDDVEQKMKEKPDIFFRKYEEEEVVKVMVLSSSSMRKNYFRYGQCLNIDYVSKIMRRRDPTGRHYTVGFYSSHNVQGNLVLFGVSLLCSEIFIHHQKALQMFFSIMENRIPICIITPDSRQLFKALDILREVHGYKFQYLINWHYVIEFLKKYANNELEKYKILELFCKAMSQPVKAKYQEHMVNLRSQMVGVNVYCQFDRVGDVFTLSKIPPIFVGYSLSTFHIEQLYSIMEANLQYEPKLSLFFASIFQIEKKIWQQGPPPPRSLPFPQLLHPKLQEAMSPIPTLESFLNVAEQTQPYYQLYIQQHNNCTFTVRYCVCCDCWHCNCRMIYFSGVPCKHLIYAIMRYDGDISYYVNSRWLDFEYEVKEEAMKQEHEDECELLEMSEKQLQEFCDLLDQNEYQELLRNYDDQQQFNNN